MCKLGATTKSAYNAAGGARAGIATAIGTARSASRSPTVSGAELHGLQRRRRERGTPEGYRRSRRVVCAGAHRPGPNYLRFACRSGSGFFVVWVLTPAQKATSSDFPYCRVTVDMEIHFPN